MMMQLRLKTQYTMIIVATIVVNVLILSTVLLYQFQVATREVATEGTQSVAADLLSRFEKVGMERTTGIGQTLTNPLFLYHFDQIQATLDTFKKDKDVLEAVVYDPRGNILHDGSRTMREHGKPSRDIELATQAIRQRQTVSKMLPDELRIAYPIYVEHEALGGVLVSYSLAKTLSEATETGRRIHSISENGVRRNTYTLIFMTIILAALGGVLAMAVARRLIQPIQQLVTYAKQIGLGIYDFTLNIPRQDELGDLANALEEMRDNLRRSTEEVRFLAYHDRLTGLPNRAMFKEYLDRALDEARRKGHYLALIFIDIDNFKRINDTFGHQAGDTVLQTMASRINDSLRPLDFFAAAGKSDNDPVTARLGGDEFIALVPLTRGPLDAASLARRLLKETVEPIMIETKQVFISASVGISIYPNDGKDSSELVKHADMAMYQAKSEGKNTYKFFTESLNERVSHNMEIELELRHALENGEIKVHYQPQLDLTTGDIVGAEALVRWQHPKRGLVMPGEFIPVAEDAGLIVPIGEFVMREAAKQAVAWRVAGKPSFYVSVNVSSLQFRRNDLPSVIKDILRDTRAPSDAIHIELTESNLMKAEDQALEQLQQIRALGVRIWIDDFGTGYSSLSYLQRFAVDGVKIDRSFVFKLSENKNNRSLTRAVIAMAQSLDLSVVAEGVETEDQEKILKTDGCPYVQGFRYSRPVPAEELSKMLSVRTGNNVVSLGRLKD